MLVNNDMGEKCQKKRTNNVETENKIEKFERKYIVTSTKMDKF